MNAVLWKIGPVINLQRGKYKGTPGQLFIFKELDTNVQTKMYLPMQYEHSDDWLAYAQEGNVFYGINMGEDGVSIAWWNGFDKVEVKPVNMSKEEL